LSRSCGLLGIADWDTSRLSVDVGILVKPLAWLALTDFHRVEPQYLATSDRAARLSICDITTNAILAQKPVDTLAGRDATLLTAAIVSESLVVAAFNLDDHTTDRELHVVLSAATLQPRSTVDYPHSAQHHRLRRSAESGTWLTRAQTNKGATLCLWQLDGLLDDDPLPGPRSLQDAGPPCASGRGRQTVRERADSRDCSR
jgi:hypothetical protein